MSRKKLQPQASDSIEAMAQHCGEVAAFLKALANEKRLQILCVLSEGEKSVGQINVEVDLSLSALSQHLAWLREASFVATRREAQTIYYRLDDQRVIRVMQLLKSLFCQ